MKALPRCPAHGGARKAPFASLLLHQGLCWDGIGEDTFVAGPWHRGVVANDLEMQMCGPLAMLEGELGATWGTWGCPSPTSAVVRMSFICSRIRSANTYRTPAHPRHRGRCWGQKEYEEAGRVLKTGSNGLCLGGCSVASAETSPGLKVQAGTQVWRVTCRVCGGHPARSRRGHVPRVQDGA